MRETAGRPSSGRPRSTRSIALELLARGTWSGAGVLGPEAFDAAPFLDMLAEYGSPHGIVELTSRRTARGSLAREGNRPACCLFLPMSEPWTMPARNLLANRHEERRWRHETR